MRSLSSYFEHRPLLTLLASGTSASIGLMVLRVTAAWYVLRHAQSAAGWALLMGFASLLETYSKPILGALPDRYGPGNVYRLGMAWSLPWVALSLLFPTTELAPLFIAALVFIPLSVTSTLRGVASAPLATSVSETGGMEKTQLHRATAFAVSSLGGPIAVALFVSPAHPWLAFAGILSALGAAFWLSAQLPAQTAPRFDSTLSQRVRAALASTVDCVQCVRKNHVELLSVTASALTNCVLGALMLVLLPAVFVLRFQGSAFDVAMADVAVGAGLLVSSLWATPLLNQWIGRYRTQILSSVLIAVPFLAAAVIPDKYWVTGLHLFAGLGIGAALVNTSTVRALATPATHYSRANTGAMFLSTALTPFFTLACGPLLDSLGLDKVLLICVALCVASSLVVILNTDLAHIMALPPEAQKGAYGRMFPAAYSGQ